MRETFKATARAQSREDLLTGLNAQADQYFAGLSYRLLELNVELVELVRQGTTGRTFGQAAYEGTGLYVAGGEEDSRPWG